MQRDFYASIVDFIGNFERHMEMIGSRSELREKAIEEIGEEIDLKECYETEYWLELFVKSELLERENAKKIYNDCGTIRRMLISSINTAKENK